MKNYIYEDQIEKSIIKVFKEKLGYNHIDCFTVDKEDINDNSNRKDKREVVLKDILEKKVKEINPNVPEEAIKKALKELTKDRTVMNKNLANKEIYELIKDGIQVLCKDEDGKETKVRVKIIDFNTSKINKNDFTIVSQLWIKGKTYYTRPDLIIYINGLPLVFIELKNSNKKLINAYTDNLTRYKEQIPQIFDYNQICILSNALETKLGSYTGDWEHFFEWLRIEDEKEKIDKKKIKDKKISLEYTVLGLCKKENLLDYIENFILYYKKTNKIIAKNHQFLGVNKAVKSFEERENKKGKLGVFWHTQGSGKSFSMVFFARKILRKYTGNYRFLIVTDRKDLDEQIYKNFLNSEVIKKGEKTSPKDGTKLREYLKANKRFVFTLIQKFTCDKGKKYEVITDDSNIIVIVDEAHRTQYKILAENMRAGLPNAQYIAFTGTPLLGKDRKTNSWFGEYISEYNFLQSVEDGATVPLYYSKRVPTVLIQNDDLDDEFTQILEDENLNEEQMQKLEKEYADEIQVIKRDDRLETIAKDIVYHFPRRGYKGKGMVITVDKFTAVNMYNKVQYHWKEEIKKLRKELKNIEDKKENIKVKEILDYMHSVEMAVVVSEEAGEEEKFMKQGLDIKPHRKKMNEVDENGFDIEDNFKDPHHKLQLVFVCSMWLTGFDAPTVSILYLDKPMKNHTLMQTIARANRVAPGKINGLIVDYYNVFRNMKKALADYAQGEDKEGQDPIQDKSHLYKLLDDAIDEAVKFCKSIDVKLKIILKSDEVFKNLEYFMEFANKLLEKDEWKKQFIVYDNTITSLYESCKPEILGDNKERKLINVIKYLRQILDERSSDENIERAKQKIDELLDESVFTDNNTLSKDKEYVYGIQKSKTINLSKFDFDKLKENFRRSKYKNIEIADLRAFIQDKLEKMLKKNINRVNFAQKLQQIIDKYNSGATETESFYEELMKFTQDLEEEEKRHIKEGLSEEELELFDLIEKEKLTKNERQQVKLAAKTLLKRLTDEKEKILVQDWYKDTVTKEKVETSIKRILDETLPNSYDRIMFEEKCGVVIKHIYTMAHESTMSSQS